MPNLKRALALSTVALVALGPLAGCAAYRYQHAPRPAPSRAPLAVEVAVPVQPASAEFQRLRSDDQTAQVRGEVEETRRNLEVQGHYSCCIKPPCNECLVRRGECHCRELVDKDKKSPCGECTQAWIDGRGALDAVTVQDILKHQAAAVEEKGQPKESPPPPEPKQ
jgi:hypothetical protein